MSSNVFSSFIKTKQTFPGPRNYKFWWPVKKSNIYFAKESEISESRPLQLQVNCGPRRTHPVPDICVASFTNSSRKVKLNSVRLLLEVDHFIFVPQMQQRDFLIKLNSRSGRNYKSIRQGSRRTRNALLPSGPEYPFCPRQQLSSIENNANKLGGSVIKPRRHAENVHVSRIRQGNFG